MPPAPRRAEGAGFLSVRGLAKAFGGVRAVDGVDLTLGPGELRCIIGPNGCGKTTLFNLLTGYLQPTAGSITFRGRTLEGLDLHEVAAAGIVRKFQVPSVFPSLTVTENLRAAAAAAREARGGLARAQGLIAAVALDQRIDEPAGALSHGQTQWLELAMVLATEPLLVLLDEPAAGMTRTEKTRTVDLIGEIRRETGVAILLIEHDMAFVKALDCPVSVMVMGRIVASGTFDEIRRDPLVRRAYLGTTHG
jgi:ABC-type branched-subunit amino acid transport system ATPase component